MENLAPASCSHVVPFSSGYKVANNSRDLRYTLGSIAKTINETRQTDTAASLNNTKVRYLGSCLIDGDLGQILGDIGNVIFSALSIAQICHPILAASNTFSWTSCILGSFGGILNIGVGLYCLNSAQIKHGNLSSEGKEYIKEHGPALSFILSMKGDAPLDVQKYYRTLWDGIFMSGIGAVMTVISLSIKVAKLGAIGTFLAANPWVLPLLWFVITVPILIEVARSNKNIWNGTDLAGLMELGALKEALSKETNFIGSENNPLTKISVDQDPVEYETNILNSLKARIGDEAAVEAMCLRNLLLKETSSGEISLQINNLEKAIVAWKKAQKCTGPESNDLNELEASIGAEAVTELTRLKDLLLKDESSHEAGLQISKLRATIAAWDWAQKYIKHENNILKDLEASIGAEAAIEAMHLRGLLLAETCSINQLRVQTKKLENAIAAWNEAQKCKLVQQSLLITSFALSIIGLSPQVPQKIIGVATNGVILLGNFIPLWMDIAWPFRRNCPMDVPITDEGAILKKMQTAEVLPEEEIA